MKKVTRRTTVAMAGEESMCVLLPAWRLVCLDNRYFRRTAYNSSGLFVLTSIATVTHTCVVLSKVDWYCEFVVFLMSSKYIVCISVPSSFFIFSS